MTSKTFALSTIPNSFRYESKTVNGVSQGKIDLSELNLRVKPVDSNIYHPDNSHTNLSQVPIKAQCGEDVALLGVTFIGKVLDAEDVYITGVSYGAKLGFVIYADSGQGSEQDELIAFIDVCEITTGGDIDLRWSNGPLKIAKF